MEMIKTCVCGGGGDAEECCGCGCGCTRCCNDVRDCTMWLLRMIFNLRVLKWIGIIVTSIVGLWVAIFPLPNLILSGIISDMYCPYGVIAWCGTRVQFDGKNYDDMFLTFIGICFSIVILMIITITSTYWKLRKDCCCNDVDRDWRKRGCYVTTIFVWVWFLWMIISIPVAMKVGFAGITTQFWNATKSFGECRKYSDFAPFVLHDTLYVYDSDVDKFEVYTCDIYRSLGYLSGVIYDRSLPFNYTECSKCMTTGVVSTYFAIILIPILVFLFIVLIIYTCKRYTKAKKQILSKYYGEEDYILNRDNA